MKNDRRTKRAGGWLAVLAGATVMGASLAIGLSGPAAAQVETEPAAASSPASPPSGPPPSERIDVEQAVDFPYDI